MKVTILGCGSSLGVPALKYGWGNCDSANPKNRRTRSSIIIEQGNTVLLVDTSPDLREQLLQFGGDKNITGVLFTHAHFDHVNGLNELRPIFLHAGVDIYATAQTLEGIKQSCAYLFEHSNYDIYDTYLNVHEIKLGEFSIQDIKGICFEQDHGYSKSLGFRINNFAYCTDVADIQDFSSLGNLDVWVVDCLNIGEKRPTHANVDMVLQWVDRIKPKKTYLTHMDSSMDYNHLVSILPDNIEPAYDQLVIDC